MDTYTPKASTVVDFEPFGKGPPTVFLGPEDADEPHQPRAYCTPNVVAKLLLVTGVLTSLMGILYGTVLPASINAAVNHHVVRCSDDSVAEEVYLDPYGECDDCSPYYLSLYMLNATNAETFLASNVTLQVQEMGPYVYRRRAIKLDVSLSEDASTVTYKTYTYHTFEADRSCFDCTASDEIVSFDTGYLSVIAAAGGEFNLLASVAAQSFGAGLNRTELTSIIAEHGDQIMRWLNGLNSLDPVAMNTVTTNNTVLDFFTSGPTALAAMDLSGFAYNGLFVKRTASQWALGYPSLLVGLLLGVNYIAPCQLSLNAQCSSCSGDDCHAIAAACSQCTKGAAIVAANNVTCASIESMYAAAYGPIEAATVVATTCGLCETRGLCAAPLPGIAETSGMDYSETAPDASILRDYVQHTGCDDRTKIGAYVAYDGMTVAPVWVHLNARRNPTLAEINAFSSYAHCDHLPFANITCVRVSGTDGTALKPGGVTIHGMATQTTTDTFDTYVGPAKLSVTISSMDTNVDFHGVSLHRFGTPVDVFDYTDETADLGTGIPVNGLQQLSFLTGFLSYLSGPFFIHGDPSLLEAVQMTNTNGIVMTAENMYDTNGDLLESIHSAYGTFVDIESGTGQTMSARKRLQVSYALAASMSVPNASMSDVLWPSLPTEVVMPAYWVQEAGEAKDSVLDRFKNLLTLVKTFLTGLIVLIIAGLLEVAGGVLLWRRYKQKLEKQRSGSNSGI